MSRIPLSHSTLHNTSFAPEMNGAAAGAPGADTRRKQSKKDEVSTAMCSSSRAPSSRRHVFQEREGVVLEAIGGRARSARTSGFCCMSQLGHGTIGLSFLAYALPIKRKTAYCTQLPNSGLIRGVIFLAIVDIHAVATPFPTTLFPRPFAFVPIKYTFRVPE